jgi:hypothetical protein
LWAENPLFLFEDSRDCARYLTEELTAALTLPNDESKLVHRLADEPRPLSVDKELKALQNLMDALVPIIVAGSPSAPVELFAIVYGLAEMIATLRDQLAEGALVRLRRKGDDDSAAIGLLTSLYEELLSAQVRQVMVERGLADLVIADHHGATDLDWLHEFGRRLIFGDDPFGFDQALTRALLTEELAMLLALEDIDFGITRYVVATCDPAPEDPTWLSRMGAALTEDVRRKQDCSVEADEPDAFLRPTFISVTGDSAAMLADLAHQLWLTEPDTLLVAIAETETDYRCLVRALTEGRVVPAPASRLLH